MFIPSAHQQAYFDWIQDGAGHATLIAVAGAGKTTTVMQGFRFMRGRVIYLVFAAKNGREAKEKVAADPELSVRGANPKSNDALFVSTFHSAGQKALMFSVPQLKKSGRDAVDGKKVQKIIDAIIQNPDQPRYDLQPLASSVARIVAMAKNRGFGVFHPISDTAEWENMISKFDLDADLPEDARLDQVIKFAQVVLNKSNRELATIDFDDMVYLPLLLKLRMLQHDYVVCDEFQDSNPTRRALAEKMLAPGGRLVVVGDPHQAIMGFTGADNDAMAKFTREHRATELPLTVSYRCPRAVVAHAQQWVSHIQAHNDAIEGSVTELDYNELINTASPGDAVLCRYNKYLVTTCFKFIRAGKAAKIEGRSIGEGLVKLAGKWKVKSLDALQGRLETYLAREVAKAQAKGDEAKADRITDQVETLRVLIERAEEQKMTTVAELRLMIEGIFADDATASSPGSVILCSAHKSKGLEWDRVFLLAREGLMPSRRATQPWVVEQEVNLIYVSVTRAKQALVEVTGMPITN